MSSTTPAMRQFHAAKEQYPDALLFFRMGDFYELFHDDAITASKALGIALTSRSKGANAIPMAGVPVRAVDTYTSRLLKAGYRVAVCEQMQDPRDAKGVVEREVVRVLTPGTLTEDHLLEDGVANHLAACMTHKGRAGLAWVELSTGAFQVCEVPQSELADELDRIDPTEILLPGGERDENGDLQLAIPGRASCTWRQDHRFGTDSSRDRLLEFFGVGSLAGFGLEDGPDGTPADRLAVGAAGALIDYLQETQLAALPHITQMEVFQRDGVMHLDRATRQSLELVATQRGDGTPLLNVLDKTRTPMGRRLLRQWLLAPLTRSAAIHGRQGAVAALHDQRGTARSLHQALGDVLDLERLATRIATGRANGRDLMALAQSVAGIPGLRQQLADCAQQDDELDRLLQQLDPMQEMVASIQTALVEEPPTTIKEGGLIRPGHHEELDSLLSLAKDSRTWMAEFQAREAERTGAANLKVGFNKVFGYYIEITHGNKGAEIPPDYVRKQTTKNAERYITDELKEFETKVLTAEEKARELEYDLFLALRDEIAAQVPKVQRLAHAIAQLDVLVGFAVLAAERDYCRPTVDDSQTLSIRDGRHPVIEATHAAGTFVPNDTDLDCPDRALVLLTGPNMAGKSTYIRQNALIALIAQLGSFVPASEAHIGVVDRIFTRVGAADDISRGASTFMVEMTETANILNHATARSLVILDEVGRGTSTYDGLSLAWAIAEDLHKRIRCRCLFATHYHQMTDMAVDADGRTTGVVNQRVAVKEWGEEIVFLHRIEEGGTDKSYGLHVARLAGIPRPVLERARLILDRLEDEGEHTRQKLVEPGPRNDGSAKQLALFAPQVDTLAEALADVDPDGMTPLQALEWLAAQKRQVTSEQH